MPGTEEYTPAKKPSAKYESLTGFEAAMIDQFGLMAQQHSERDAVMLEEFRGLRRDITRAFLGIGIGGFALILFLTAGVMLLRGIDPQQAAGATTTVVETASGVVSVETKKVEPGSVTTTTATTTTTEEAGGAGE